MHIHGSCHCGNLSFTLEGLPASGPIPARACDCTFCSLHGAAWTAIPDGHLQIRVLDPSLLSNYAFGTRTAEFHICARCGGVPVVSSLIDGNLYAVVNIKSFVGLDPARLSLTAVSLEGEAQASRLARRKRNWIGSVRFETAPPDHPGPAASETMA